VYIALLHTHTLMIMLLLCVTASLGAMSVPHVPMVDPSFGTPWLSGPGQPGWSKSEFGCVGFSSFESMSSQLPPEEWGLHTAGVYYRNWPVDNVVTSYFGDQNLNLTGEVPFKRQLYQSMLGQVSERCRLIN
jgi:hypothetical protein